jgi:ArsR family transcriptional regulator
MTTASTFSAQADATTCTPAAPLPHLDPAATSDLAHELKALSDPTRLQLLELVAAHVGQTACICDLTASLHVTQPTVSHHMRLLVEAGLVTRQQRGKWVHYRVRTAELRRLGASVSGLAGVAQATAPEKEV